MKWPEEIIRETTRTLALKLGWLSSLIAHLEAELRVHLGEAWISGHESLIPDDERREGSSRRSGRTRIRGPGFRSKPKPITLVIAADHGTANFPNLLLRRNLPRTASLCPTPFQLLYPRMQEEILRGLQNDLGPTTLLEDILLCNIAASTERLNCSSHPEATVLNRFMEDAPPRSSPRNLRLHLGGVMEGRRQRNAFFRSGDVRSTAGRSLLGCMRLLCLEKR